MCKYFFHNRKDCYWLLFFAVVLCWIVSSSLKDGFLQIISFNYERKSEILQVKTLIMSGILIIDNTVPQVFGIFTALLNIVFSLEKKNPYLLIPGSDRFYRNIKFMSSRQFVTSSHLLIQFYPLGISCQSHERKQPVQFISAGGWQQLQTQLQSLQS